MDAQIYQQTRNRFDDLPEELVKRIFSFLPTRSAVKASLVCKPWKDLWMSLPNLTFKEYESVTWSHVPSLSKEEILELAYIESLNITDIEIGSDQPERDFLEFVSRVIWYRKPLKINVFSLDLDVKDDSDLISVWLDYAVHHGVEVFHLRLFCETCLRPLHVLSPSFFNCKSLTELHLKIHGILVLPTALVNFPSLKILKVGAWFAGDTMTMSQLFSNCPLLEELHLVECSFTGLGNVHISAPRLTSLSIVEVYDSSAFHVTARCQVFIHGTKLKCFNYQGQLMNEYRFVTDSPSLQEACIRINHLNDVEKKHVDRANRLLEELYNVNCLSISCGTLEFLDKEKDLIFTKLPVFQNLTHLRLTHGCVNIPSDGLLTLLTKSPSLHHLEFMEGLQIVHTEVMGLQPTLQCFLTSLWNVTIAKFYGTNEEYCGLKVILRLSTVLEKLDIKFMGDTTAKREVLKRLSEMFPKEMLQCISIS